MYKSDVMTVGQLLRKLDGIPKDTHVVITEDFSGVAYHAYYDKAEKTFCIVGYEEELEDDTDWE